MVSSEKWNEMTKESYVETTYEDMITRAKIEPSFRDGLLAAVSVCRAQGRGLYPCPSDMAAVYIERLANGEMP